MTIRRDAVWHAEEMKRYVAMLAAAVVVVVVALQLFGRGDHVRVALPKDTSTRTLSQLESRGFTPWMSDLRHGVATGCNIEYCDPRELSYRDAFFTTDNGARTWTDVSRNWPSAVTALWASASWVQFHGPNQGWALTPTGLFWTRNGGSVVHNSDALGHLLDVQIGAGRVAAVAAVHCRHHVARYKSCSEVFESAPLFSTRWTVRAIPDHPTALWPTPDANYAPQAGFLNVSPHGVVALYDNGVHPAGVAVTSTGGQQWTRGTTPCGFTPTMNELTFAASTTTDWVAICQGPGTGNQLWHSTTAGRSWSWVLGCDASARCRGGLSHVSVDSYYSLQIVTNNSATRYVLLALAGPGVPSTFESSDRGAHWYPVALPRSVGRLLRVNNVDPYGATTVQPFGPDGFQLTNGSRVVAQWGPRGWLLEGGS